MYGLIIATFEGRMGLKTLEGVLSHAHVLKAISRLFMGRRSLLSGGSNGQASNRYGRTGAAV